MLYVILIWYGERIFNNVWFIPAFGKRDKKAHNDSFPSNPDKLVLKPVMSLNKAFETVLCVTGTVYYARVLYPYDQWETEFFSAN